MSEGSGSEAGSSKGGSRASSRPNSAVAHSSRPTSAVANKPRSTSIGTGGGADIGERRPSAIGSRPQSASGGAGNATDNAAAVEAGGERKRAGLSRRTKAQLKALDNQYAEPPEDMELDQTALGHAKVVDDLTHRIYALKRTIDSRNMRIEAAKQKALDDFKAKLEAKAKVSVAIAINMICFALPRLFSSCINLILVPTPNSLLSIRTSPHLLPFYDIVCNAMLVRPPFYHLPCA